MTLLKSISLRISEKLRDKQYRTEFFAGLARDEIAQQIKSLRNKRKLRQVDLAHATGMKQSAVSRIEQAEYSKWNFTTLLRLADALDARIRLIFEPAEEVIAHYEQLEAEPKLSSSAIDLDGIRAAATQRVRSQIQDLSAFPQSGQIETVRQSRAVHQFGGSVMERKSSDETSIN